MSKRIALLIVCTLALSGCTTYRTKAEADAAWKVEQQLIKQRDCAITRMGSMTISEFKDCERILEESPHDH